MALELKATKHNYYSSESNYYVGGRENYGRNDYDSWEMFKEDWLFSDGTIDDDLNHLFRFDILESEENPGNFTLWLFFILQRKGIYRPVHINTITEADLPEIEEFLSKRWEYMKSQWEEFSKEVEV